MNLELSLPDVVADPLATLCIYRWTPLPTLFSSPLSAARYLFSFFCHHVHEAPVFAVAPVPYVSKTLHRLYKGVRPSPSASIGSV